MSHGGHGACEMARECHTEAMVPVGWPGSVTWRPWCLLEVFCFLLKQNYIPIINNMPT